MSRGERKHWTACTAEEMLQAGREIAQWLRPGEVVLLIGEMGAGKTTLAKGIVEGMGSAAAEEVSSPTFSLVHEYGAEPLVLHLDLYRLESEQQVRAIGIDEMLDTIESGPTAIMLVEWGERFPALWPSARREIRIRESDGSREIELE